MDLSKGIVTKEDIKKLLQTIEARKTTAPVEISTGFDRLDEMFGWLHKGQLVILAGHPGIGKTGFVISVVEHLCLKNNTSAAIFTMQLSKEQWLERMLLSCSKIELTKARNGNLDAEEWNKIAQDSHLLLEKPLYIDDTPRLAPDEIRSRIMQLNQQQPHAIQCVVIDHLQAMDTLTYQPIRREKTAELSKALKLLALEFNIPVIVLCDLDFEPLQADPARRKPTLEDMGQYLIAERYADVLMLLHRDDYYCRCDPDYEPNGTAEIIITRNQNGPTGIAGLCYLEQFSRFEELSSAAI